MLQTPDVQARISREGADPVGSSPAQFTARVKSEIDKWAKVVKAAGLAVAN
jgi:tripartite-type tricarboxylate transporter receptor subunit TctC